MQGTRGKGQGQGTRYKVQGTRYKVQGTRYKVQVKSSLCRAGSARRIDWVSGEARPTQDNRSKIHTRKGWAVRFP